MLDRKWTRLYSGALASLFSVAGSVIGISAHAETAGEIIV
jgi:hypothetical protein